MGQFEQFLDEFSREPVSAKAAHLLKNIPRDLSERARRKALLNHAGSRKKPTLPQLKCLEGDE